MPPRLKVYRAHLGFYDTVVAATSQTKAAEAWGASQRDFASGFAKVTDDRQAVEAALAHPGVVLRRPYGSQGEFKIKADLPKAPKLSAKHKRAQAAAERERERERKAEQRARAAAEKRRQREAEDELKNIEREEAALRARRQALQKKFRPHSVK